MTHSLGHAMLATTNFPPIDWPNLIAEINRIHFVIAMESEYKAQWANDFIYLSRNSKLSTVPAKSITQER